MNSAAIKTGMKTAPVPMSGWKRFALSAAIVPLALFEAWDSYMFFTTLGLSETGSGFSGVLTKIYVLTHPVFAVAALVCALAGHVRWAVAAMAGVVLGRWLWYLPGPNGSLASRDLYVLAQPTIMLLIIPPVLAACALVLARTNPRLGLATLLVCAPVIYSNYEMALFILAISIYGV